MRTWVEINLNSVSHNVREFKKILNPQTKLMAVVKADAYGHGAEKVAFTAINAGADALAVATADEAVELRKAGINVPILILGIAFDEDVKEILDYDITSTVTSYEFAKLLSDEAVKANKKVAIHIKVDTGMARIGYLYDSDIISEIIKISKLSNVQIEGIFTHFSKADEENDDFSDLQFERFMNVCQKIEENGVQLPIKHICNTAGILKNKKYHLDMVRLGISLYGHYPSGVFSEKDVKIRPVMCLKSKIVNLKVLEKGTPIGYGGTYITPSKMKIATVPIGYADGYPRNLSNKCFASINGTKCKIVGNVCMDQLMIDVTDVKSIKFCDEVILFGESGNNNINVEEVASYADTISYELFCRISKRVPRIYIK